MRRYRVKRPVCTGYSLKDALKLWRLSRWPRNKHCINSHWAGCSEVWLSVSPLGSATVAASAPVRLPAHLGVVNHAKHALISGKPRILVSAFSWYTATLKINTLRFVASLFGEYLVVVEKTSIILRM